MPWADLSDVRLYYELLGAGEPLLLIPGLGASCRMWDPVAPELAERFTLVMPDNRDVGKSVGKRRPHTLSDFVADLVELLDHLQLDRVRVLGISLGGVIAQCLALEHPGRVDRLVLVSTAHRFGPYLRDVAAMLGRSLYRMSYAQFLRTMELLGTSPGYYDAHAADIEQRIDQLRKQHAPRGAVTTQLRCLAVSEVDEPDYRIAVPTLVMSGEYDALIPNCYSKRMADAIPGSEFRVMQACGHNPLSEQPAVALPIVTEFLRRPMANPTQNSGPRRDDTPSEAYDFSRRTNVITLDVSK